MQNSERELFANIKKIHHQMPRWVIFLIIVSLLIFLAYHIANLLVILILSGILAYILSDIVNKFESFGLKRNLVVVMLYLIVAGIIAGAEIILSPYLQHEIKNFYTKLPEFSQELENALASRYNTDMGSSPLTEEIIRKILGEVISPGRFISKTFNFSEVFSQAASFFLAVLIMPFFVFFLLKDWPRILKTVMGWVPPSYVETTVSAISEINILVGKYIRGLALDCILVAIVAAIGLWLTGVNYPISLGILTGVANVIPYLGPIMACLASCIIAFVQFNSIGALLNIVLLYIMIKLIDDLIIQPFTIGKSVSLHPMMLIITIISGEKLFGVIGMILAVPIVTSMLKVLSILIENHRHNVKRGAAETTTDIILENKIPT